jgi:hypothetical protein
MGNINKATIAEWLILAALIALAAYFALPGPQFLAQ